VAHRVQEFYEAEHFSKLELTAPFTDYLTREAELICRNVTGRSALELGCGTGRILGIIPSHIQVTGIDYSQRAIDLARMSQGTRSNVGLAQMDACAMGFSNDSFDCAIAAWNFLGNQHRGRDRCLEETGRVLRPQGMLLASVLADSVLSAYLGFVRANGLHVEYITRDYVVLREGLVSERFGIGKLQSVVKRAGFDLLEVTPISDIALWCKAVRR